jgi:FdhD protein
MAVEDVGRHNAVDAVAGRMWLEGLSGADKVMFITGRFAWEIVMKAALMGIPTLISKAGITSRGLELAQDLGMVVIGRAKANGFVLYNGWDQVDFDAAPGPA